MIKDSELKLIKQLEKEIGEKLEKREFEKIFEGGQKGFEGLFQIPERKNSSLK